MYNACIFNYHSAQCTLYNVLVHTYVQCTLYKWECNIYIIYES